MFFFKKKNVILIYGSNGWIGNLFKEYLTSQNIKFIEGNARIDNYTDLFIELRVVKPTHVISFTGRTHGKINETNVNTIDYLEYPGKLTENIRDNLYGPINLADICVRKGIHYTYLGTGCIFNSNENETFTEENIPNYFGSSYSIVKGFTDRLMHNYNVLNLRIRMPIHSVPNSRNFITKITNYSKICSIPNSMTVLDDFFPIFLDMMLKKKTGTYNCTNPGIISHNEILEEYKTHIPDFTWENMTLEEQSKILKSDRSNNHLNTLKVQSEYPKLKAIDESIKDILSIYVKKSN